MRLACYSLHYLGSLMLSPYPLLPVHVTPFPERSVQTSPTMVNFQNGVMGGDENGNSAPREGIEPTSLAVRTSVLSVTPPRLPNVITLSTPICLCGSCSEWSVETTTMVYIHQLFNVYTVHEYRQCMRGIFNKLTAFVLYGVMCRLFKRVVT